MGQTSPKTVRETSCFEPGSGKGAHIMGTLVDKGKISSKRAGGVPFSICVLACTLGTLVAHKVGCLVREQYYKREEPVQQKAFFSDANEQLAKAIRTRQIGNIHASCASNECPSSFRKVVLDELLFPFGFGQTGENLDDNDEEDDDDEDVMEEDDDAACGILVKVDLMFVDLNFLSSVESLQRALLSVIWDESANRHLRLEKIQCQISGRVTCTATFNDGNFLHVSSHPEEGGMIFLSAYVVGRGGDLMSLITLMRQHFSVPATKDRSVRSSWRLQPLGKYPHPVGPFLADDLFGLSWSPHFVEMYKTLIADEMSNFQRITVVEKVNVKTKSLDGYEASIIPSSTSYAATNPQFFRPTRVLFLDGTSQSTSQCDAGYHEALVHPGMFAHQSGPKRVAIVGGGEGATLREVLKHKSVDKCIMIEIDPDMVRVAREALPVWNDCSGFSQTDVNCFDHPRADVRFEDAFAWFRNNFGPSATIHAEDPLDLVIMDALDPEGTAEIARELYRNEDFWVSIKQALTKDGILVMQMGAAPTNEDVGEQFSDWHNRDAFLEVIDRVGFQQMFTYVEHHAGFGQPWTFLVACVSDRCRDPWFHSPAQVNLEMSKRIHRRRSDGQVALDFFDGVLVSEYQRPRRHWEWVYCQKVPAPVECGLANSNAKRSALDVVAGLRNTADLRVVAALARAISISRTEALKSMSEYRPRTSHLSSPVAGRHFALLLAEHLSGDRTDASS